MSSLDQSIHNPTGVLSTTNTRYHRLYNNPFFDYSSEMMPRDMQAYFRYGELVFANSPVVANAVRKLVNYPITDFTYKTNSERIKKDTQELLEDILQIKTHLINTSLDNFIYGNAFRTTFFPFERFLRCGVPTCGTEIAIDFANYRIKQGNFVLTCPECNQTRIAKVEDRDTNNINEIKLISWDPKSMELFSNPITGDTDYYYKLPEQIIKGIVNSNNIICAKTPMVFMEAFKAKRVVKFASNLFHLKHTTLGGFNSGWGISPLVHCLKLFMYQSIMRKASEAIALEHIVPRIILFPQGVSNDPTIMTSMRRWKEELTGAIHKWRSDPNHIFMAPYPTGTTNIGSQGRALMPTNEIKEAEESLLRALDIPMEFVYGSSNLNNTSVALRVLENQLEPQINQLNRYVNWVITTINGKFRKNFCKVKFQPFKLSDDVMQRQFHFQLAAMGKLSSTTLQESMGIDPFKEEEKMMEEQIRAQRRQKELEKKIMEEEQNIANQAEQHAQAARQDTVPQYDQQKLIAKAQEIAYQMLQMPYEQRRSALSQLSNEDYVMYALVTAQMESMRKTIEEQPQQGAQGR